MGGGGGTYGVKLSHTMALCLGNLLAQDEILQKDQTPTQVPISEWSQFSHTSTGIFN